MSMRSDRLTVPVPTAGLPRPGPRPARKSPDTRVRHAASVLAGPQVRREVDDAAKPGQGLAPAFKRLRVGVQHARDPEVERAVGEGEERPVAGRLQEHGDCRLPRLARQPRPVELEAAVALQDADIPPDALVREDEDAACARGQRALDPLREPADQLLRNGPGAVDARAWGVAAADHPDGPRRAERIDLGVD